MLRMTRWRPGFGGQEQPQDKFDSHEYKVARHLPRYDVAGGS